MFCQFGFDPIRSIRIALFLVEGYLFIVHPPLFSFILAVLETRLLLEQEHMLIMMLEVLLLLEMVTL